MSNNRPDVGQLIVKNTVDMKPAEKDKWTDWASVQHAISKDRKEFVALIMANTGGKNPEDNEGWTALHEAAMKGRTEIFCLVLDQVQDKNPRDRQLGYRWTPLHIAAAEGNKAGFIFGHLAQNPHFDNVTRRHRHS